MRQQIHKTYIYTALPCEAKPVVDFFCLKKEMAVSAFAMYTNKDICLTVTGCGKAAMAAGIAYSQALCSPVGHPVMLNIGIAGHPEYALGEVFLVDKVTDVDSGRRYYPPVVFSPSCRTESVSTAAKPQLHYQECCLYDMEASAFYEVATRFSCAELVHSLKVVSDNKTSPVSQINAKQAGALIAANMPAVATILDALAGLAKKLPVIRHGQYQQLLERYRLTASGQKQLQDLLCRYTLLTGNPTIDIDEAKVESGKALLQWLQQRIGQCELRL